MECCVSLGENINHSSSIMYDSVQTLSWITCGKMGHFVRKRSTQSIEKRLGCSKLEESRKWCLLPEFITAHQRPDRHYICLSIGLKLADFKRGWSWVTAWGRDEDILTFLGKIHLRINKAGSISYNEYICRKKSNAEHFVSLCSILT